MKDIPVFRAPGPMDKGKLTSPDEALPYERYHESVKRLGEETGFGQALTTYCLRRATGNAINGKSCLSQLRKVLMKRVVDDPDSKDAVRNLIMDHTNSAPLELTP